MEEEDEKLEALKNDWNSVNERLSRESILRIH